MSDTSNEHICFDIHSLIDFIIFKECVGDGVGNDGEFEAIFKNISDSKTDTINGDRTLRYDEIDSIFWSFYDKVSLIGVWSDTFDDSNAVDMPLHKMPIKPRICK